MKLPNKRTALILAGLVGLAVVVFLLLSRAGLINQQEYKSTDYNFRYPAGWVVQDPKTSPVANVFKVWIKKPNTNISFGVRERGSGYSGDLATLSSELAQSLGVLPGFKEISATETMVAGINSLRYEYTKEEKTDNGTPYTAHQVFVIIPQNDKLTYLVATAEESVFKTTESQFDRIIKSFQTL